MTYEIPLYRLARPKIILSMSVYRVPGVVYTHKISCLKTLPLNNGETYNTWVLLWLPSFLCTQKVSTLLKSVSVSGRPAGRPFIR